MTTATGILLIVVPVLFTLFYALLGATFSYPGILREPAAVVLERFAAGGTRLVLLWWAFAMSAVAFIPVALGVASLIDGPLAAASSTLGVLAALVQALGLVRWPFLVPFLARERHRAPETVDLVFDVANRYLGIAIGEHLGYLLTASWTIVVSVAILPIAPFAFVIAGLAVGTSLLVGALEFVGLNERSGWHVAGTVVAVGYTAWALWLVVGGVLLIVGG